MDQNNWQILGNAIDRFEMLNVHLIAEYVPSLSIIGIFSSYIKVGPNGWYFRPAARVGRCRCNGCKTREQRKSRGDGYAGNVTHLGLGGLYRVSWGRT